MLTAKLLCNVHVKSLQWMHHGKLYTYRACKYVHIIKSNKSTLLNKGSTYPGNSLSTDKPVALGFCCLEDHIIMASGRTMDLARPGVAYCNIVDRAVNCTNY